MSDKKKYVDIIMILDRSGSMEVVQDTTIANFNQFITDQRIVPGDAKLTLVQFDDQYQVDYNDVDLQNVTLLNKDTYMPRGMTALYDAIGKTIDNKGMRYTLIEEKNRPEKIVFVIITDGFENASKEYTSDSVAKRITHQQDKYNWQFIFLGANQDAILSGKSIGINSNFSMTYANNAVGVTSAYRSVGSNLANYRMGSSDTMAFTDADREKQGEAGV